MNKKIKAHFGPLEKDVLPEKIADSLLTMIKARQLRPGDRLPPERELAATMGVGRPSLREALRALALMNIIEIRQGSGAYVSSLEPSRLVEHLDLVFALDDSTFLELLDARKILEAGIIALAAERITAEEIEAMEACLSRSLQTGDDPEAFLQADIELHTMIFQAARNPILARFMDSLNQLGLASRRRTVSLPGVAARSLQDHQQIVAALKDRDPQAARQAMLDHLNHVEQKLAQITQTEARDGYPA